MQPYYAVAFTADIQTVFWGAQKTNQQQKSSLSSNIKNEQKLQSIIQSITKIRIISPWSIIGIMKPVSLFIRITYLIKSILSQALITLHIKCLAFYIYMNIKIYVLKSCLKFKLR